MAVLLDTSVLIDVYRGNRAVSGFVSGLLERRERVGVCPVVVAEFFTGLDPAAREKWSEFVGGLICWDAGCSIGQRAGELRYQLRRAGRTLHATDGLIAATALVYGLALVTSNEKDFVQAGVRTINPRVAGPGQPS